MADILKIMQQAQQMQARLQEVQEELQRATVTGAAGGGMVTVEADACVLAIGQAPDLSFLKPADGVELTPAAADCEVLVLIWVVLAGSAMQAVQVDTADVIVIGMFEQGCIASYDALKNLGIDATATAIIAVSPCHGAAMQQHMADVGESGILPNGWYFTGSGYNLFTGNADSGTDTVLDVLAAAGKPELAYGVGSEEVIGGLMTMVKHLNALDGDYSVASIDGPGFLAVQVVR
mgnify:CR=1 FL=1